MLNNLDNLNKLFLNLVEVAPGPPWTLPRIVNLHFI